MGYADVVELLLKNVPPASLAATDNMGKTPLHFAAREAPNP